MKNVVYINLTIFSLLLLGDHSQSIEFQTDQGFLQEISFCITVLEASMASTVKSQFWKLQT